VNIRAVTHPRMGTPLSSIEPQPLLEPPGFIVRNYGRPGSPLASLAAYMACGVSVGGLAALGP